MMKDDDDDLYITDEQYLDLLKKVRADLGKIEEFDMEDSTEIGFKHTVCNVGLCAGVLAKTGTWYQDKYTTLETALWPDQFKRIGKVKYENPQMFAMKYRRSKHRCPLDNRKTPKRYLACGCFYRCQAFNGKKLMMERVKQLYDVMIKEIEGRA